MYFLVIFTSHLLLILFEFFAPVSDLLTNWYFPAHEGWYVEANPTHPCEVSQRPERCDRGEFNGVLSYLQCECSVSFLLITLGFTSSIDANMG